MKKYLYLFLSLAMILSTTNSYAAMTDGERRICDNVKTDACVRICNLKKNGEFVEIDNKADSIQCSIDSIPYQKQKNSKK